MNFFKLFTASPLFCVPSFRGTLLAVQSMYREYRASSSGKWDHQIKTFWNTETYEYVNYFKALQVTLSREQQQQNSVSQLRAPCFVLSSYLLN